MPTTTNFGWTTPADTDLVKDGASAIRTLGNGIDTSLLDLKGGTTGQVLSKASNTDLDFTFITPASGGTVVKVQSTTITPAFSTSSTTYVDVTGFNVTITPTSSSSKVLILANFTFQNPGAYTDYATARLLRGTTAIVDPITRANDNNAYVLESANIIYLDSPATTSATTYKIQLKTSNAAEPAKMGADFSGTPTYACTITAIEIGA